MEHRIKVKVYYEDTDSLGLVYYANYLKYLERARTELIDESVRPIQLWNAAGFNFAVYQLQIKYLKPARLGEELEVVTSVREASDYQRKLRQEIHRRGEVITEAKVDLVCLDAELQLRTFPADAMP